MSDDDDDDWTSSSSDDDDVSPKKARLTLAPGEPDNQLKKIADFVCKTSHIDILRWRYSSPRYVNLRTQEMFDNLVNLYATVFTVQWRDNHYEHRMSCLSPPTGVPLPIYAARCYISMWFIDLYVSNRDAVWKLSSDAFDKHYQGKLYHICHRYDYYLALLNASIRPTCLEYNLDNALYVPVIADSVNVADDLNPFGINNFIPKTICYKFSEIMRATSLGSSTPLSTNTTGRPCWLFDWHSNDHVFSWFSPEGNYDVEDITLAYVLGTACTPNLGPRDVDEWQYFADGIVRQDLNPMSYNRVTERGFYGSEEFRTMEVDANFSRTRALAATTCRGSATTTAEGINDQLGEEVQEDYPLMPRFRLIDWVYHDRCIFHMGEQIRDRVHELFYHFGCPESLW